MKKRLKQLLTGFMSLVLLFSAITITASAESAPPPYADAERVTDDGIGYIRMRTTPYAKDDIIKISYVLYDSEVGRANDIIIPEEIEGLPVTRIGDYAFSGLDMTSVTIPASIEIIGIRAFGGCKSLITVNFPKEDSSKLYHLNMEVFAGCKNLSTVNNIPDSLKTIGDRAFLNCESLCDFTIPDSVETIGTQAFAGCYNLNELHLPANLVNIGDNAFYGS
ncbi:MAG: leucine-rich repeat domain-containing protein, partial [Roseburia sp.]|nr:leucine-rich repeat domain-containing protein [Roseburia sp.]